MEFGNIRETKDGLRYSVVSSSDEFRGFDRVIADSHMYNYGRVFVDEWGHPLDVEYDAEEAYRDWQAFEIAGRQ